MHLPGGMLALMDATAPRRPPGRSDAGDARGGAELGRRTPTTEDEKLLERRPEPAFLDTDPWRALRILVGVRRGLRRDGRGRAGGHRLRLGAHEARGPALRAGPHDRPEAGRGGLRGDHRRRPGQHGGRQPRLPGGRRPVGRLQHRAAARAGAQPVRRPRGRVPLLLRAQDDVREVRRRVRHPARRVRDARRAVRGAHPHPDRQGPPLPGRAGRLGLLGGAARLDPRHAPDGGRRVRGATSTCSRSPTTPTRSSRSCGPTPTTDPRPRRSTAATADLAAARSG